MPFSSGSFSLYSPGNPVITGTTISSTWAVNTLGDIATGLSTCVLKDGTQTITANIPMSGFKITGLAAATTNGDAIRFEQTIVLTANLITQSLLFTDATYDIGATGATRPRDLFLSRNAVIGGTLTAVGILSASALVDLSGAAAGQIQFPATQNASSNANTLDDYEEGTWTPSLGGSTTYVLQTGNYIKIGRLVHIRGTVQVTLLGTGSASLISGLPFTADTVGQQALSVTSTTSLAVSVVSLSGNIQNGSAQIQFLGRTAAATGDSSQAVFGNSAAISFAGTYIAAS